MGNPHVLVIPYPSQGHVIPMMKLSQCLVKQGCRITFVNTEYNHKQLMKASAMKDGTGNGIRLGSVSDGLESSEERKQPEKVMKAIMQVMPQKVEELIDQVNELRRRDRLCPSRLQCWMGPGNCDKKGTPTKKQMIKLSPNMPAMNTADFMWTSFTMAPEILPIGPIFAGNPQENQQEISGQRTLLFEMARPAATSIRHIVHLAVPPF
ncbi:UDP-glycosyltransferase 83A1-like [Pistacia vera]|uniref:UDP-glycosyltransferase 83A1-like n=1 Tax=Pistacia vera TaxID=55513 RepID=UPI0012636658|nr:UDP-glycosyltransferase 83A1-like [Pistacia vera]